MRALLFGVVKAALREVGFDEGDVCGPHLFARTGEHTGGEVQGGHPVPNLGEKPRVFAGAAASFDDAAEVLARQRGRRHLLVQVAPAVLPEGVAPATLAEFAGRLAEKAPVRVGLQLSVLGSN